MKRRHLLLSSKPFSKPEFENSPASWEVLPGGASVGQFKGRNETEAPGRGQNQKENHALRQVL